MKKLFFILSLWLPTLAFAQSYKITHKGDLSSNWYYSPKSTGFEYNTIFTNPEAVKNAGELKNPVQANDYNTNLERQDQLAQLFINYMTDGGITIKAVNEITENFYSNFIADNEYDDYLQHIQTTGEQISRSDYFKSKYANGLPSKISQTTVDGHKTYYYLAKAEQDNDAKSESKELSFFVFINDAEGILITAACKYIEGKSTQTLSEYEQLMYQHISELQFTKTDGSPGGATDPSVTTPSSNPGQKESDVPWTIIIGTVSAAAVAGIIRQLVKKSAAKTKSKTNQQNKKENNDEEEEAHYILQLNKDSFRLFLNQPEVLQVQVWKVTAKGKAAVQAEVNIQNPEKNLKISAQSTGIGLNAQLLLDKQPAQQQFNLNVQATAEGKAIQKTVEIIAEGKMQIVIETLPANKRTLRPDTNKVITCLAEVMDENGKTVPELTKKIQFKPHSNWIDLSDPVMDKNRIAINIAASNPDQVSPGSHIPKNVTLSLVMDDVKEKEEILQTDLVIELLDCRLDTDVSYCSFPVTDNQKEITFNAFVENPGDEPWNFEAEYKKGTDPDEPLTQISISKKSDSEVTITLTGPVEKPGPNETALSKNLVISAYQENEKPLERHIRVTVTQVGLFIKHGADNNQLSYTAQGEFERSIEFVLYRFSKESNEIVVDKAGLKQLKFELKEEAQDIVNFESVLKVSYSFSDLVGNIPYGRYKMKSEEQMPGFGDVFTLTYLVQAPCNPEDNPEQFQLELQLKVKTYGIGTEFPDWVEAYNNCKKVILKLVPPGETQTKLYDLLEARKYTLGAEGLNELRKRIWKIAYNLILAEGAEGYKTEEAWANYITTTLEWTEWAGDLAFNALVAYYMKSAAGAVGLSMAKAGMIEALNYYIYENGSLDDFMDRQYSKIVPLLVNVAKGRVISVENIEMVVKKNKPLAVAIFVSCEFLFNLYQTKSVVEAAKLTAGQIIDEIIIRKATLQLHKNQLKYNIKVTTAQASLEDVVKNIKVKDGRQYIEVDKLMEIMRDPAQVRTLKNSAPDWLKKVFDDSRSEIYKKHDTELKKYVADTYKINPDDIKIDDFRTPGAGGSYNLNTDRDYRVLRKVKTADGQEIWIELQRKNWIDKSYETFGELTGKPYGLSDKEWAERHLQRATDRFDAEAGKDYSDHIYNADTGELIKGEPNIVKVKHGEGTLYDAEGIGKMYQNKVMNALEPGTVPEAYAQAQKAVDSLKKVKESYAGQNFEVSPTSEKLNKAMEIISGAKTDVRATPGEVETLNNQLQKLGYKDVGEVSKDIANEFKNLKQFDNKSQVYKVTQ
ncbi:MAG: hypothetical protein QM725_11110 [Lacibacter sp.]